MSGKPTGRPARDTPSDDYGSEWCGEEESAESRLLFSLDIQLPHGLITRVHSLASHISHETVCPGASLFSFLQGKAQSFLLTASTSFQRHRLFARIQCGRMNDACELLCEFEKSRARVTALSLRAAFGPSTPFHPLTFTTRHTSTCCLTHVDYTAIPYLGHLPTDVVGRSILQFVYSPDVHVVRQAHIDLHNSRGKVVKSVAPLRFVAHNGALLRSESEWSAYVNPWTRKIETVIARHRLVDAPVGDADVLSSPRDGQSLQVLPPAMAKAFEEELRALLNTTVGSGRSGTAAMCEPASSRVHLGAYIERLVETLVVNAPPAQFPSHHQHLFDKCNNQLLVSLPVQEELRVPEEGKVEEEVQLSYNQINCLENVHRLLKSQSRPESPSKDSTSEEKVRPLSVLPLTRETLMAHTKKFEEEYRDTWQRRLKRMSSDFSGAPSAKRAPPSNWTPQIREQYYRNLAPNPPLPPGKNFQITTVPLPPCDTPSATPVSTPVSDRPSAFYAVQPRSASVQDLPQPISLAIEQPSVIQTNSDLLLTQTPYAWGRQDGCSSPQPLKMATDALMLLREAA